MMIIEQFTAERKHVQTFENQIFQVNNGMDEFLTVGRKDLEFYFVRSYDWHKFKSYINKFNGKQETY